MRAMILAAGRGERMRPLTDHAPKPLLKVGEHALIEHHLYKLANSDITNIVINIAYKSTMIRDALGSGEKYNLKITYSDEGAEALETAGGIIQALPLLGDMPFLVINSDIWTDFDFSSLKLDNDKLANLVMINNPEHHHNGDFVLENGLLHREGNHKLTFSGIGIYHPDLFIGYAEGKRKLLDVLIPAMQKNKIAGLYYKGDWQDIGNPAALELINKKLG